VIGYEQGWMEGAIHSINNWYQNLKKSHNTEEFKEKMRKINSKRRTKCHC
jgi:hypothetical protein